MTLCKWKVVNWNFDMSPAKNPGENLVWKSTNISTYCIFAFSAEEWLRTRKANTNGIFRPIRVGTGKRHRASIENFHSAKWRQSIQIQTEITPVVLERIEVEHREKSLLNSFSYPTEIQCNESQLFLSTSSASMYMKSARKRPWWKISSQSSSDYQLFFFVNSSINSVEH